MLAYPDFCHSFTLHTDASGAGFGAVLEQDGDGQLYPVAHARRTLSKHERNYGVTEMEALGMLWSLRHCRLDIVTLSAKTDHLGLFYNFHYACKLMGGAYFRHFR